MSINVDLDTEHKKEVAELLVAISNLIRISTNKRVLVVSKVEFKKEEKENAD